MNKQKLQERLSYIPSILLVIIFLFHGVNALLLNKEFLSLILYVGFNDAAAQFLLLVVGVLDLLVASLVLFYPRWWNLLWAGVWPIVPITLTFLSSQKNELLELMIVPTLAFLAYWYRVKKF